jgi:hypothetical protein
MRTVKVLKSELLAKLYENRDIHNKEFAELWEEYLNEVAAGLKKLLTKARKREGDPETGLNLIKPRSYAKEYDEIIGMLEFSTDTEFDITQDEYKRYVLNEWDWSRNFAMMKTAYSKVDF